MISGATKPEVFAGFYLSINNGVIKILQVILKLL
jgi:hypothetical protein